MDETEWRLASHRVGGPVVLTVVGLTSIEWLRRGKRGHRNDRIFEKDARVHRRVGNSPGVPKCSTAGGAKEKHGMLRLKLPYTPVLLATKHLTTFKTYAPPVPWK